MELGFRILIVSVILDSLSCIPDSKSQLPDSTSFSLDEVKFPLLIISSIEMNLFTGSSKHAVHISKSHNVCWTGLLLCYISRLYISTDYFWVLVFSSWMT